MVITIMTPKLTRLFLFVSALFALCAPARAWVFEEVPDKNVTVTYRLAVAANVSTAAVLVDLSDTTNFPHKQTGVLNISSIQIEIDKAAASTTTVKIGVVNFVDSSTGSVTWFRRVEALANVSNTNVELFRSYTPNFLKLRVNPAGTPLTDGSTPFLLSNDITTGSTIYQNDVALPSPISTGGSVPGVGDLVLFAQTYTGAVTITVEVQYHADKR